MRRLPLAICVVCLVSLLAPPGNARAEEDKRFQFGLESRFTEATRSRSDDLSWSMIPTFSYQLTERFRLDAFAGVGYSEFGGLFLDLSPGFRYYLGPQRGKYRFNTGLSVGFTLFDQDKVVATDPSGNPLVHNGRDDELWLRVVPIEVEYWGNKRWGLTMALDYGERFGSDVRDDAEGFGLAAGFRFKIR